MSKPLIRVLEISLILGIFLGAAQPNASETRSPETAKDPLQKAAFAEGCFWGTEETFRTLKGVKSTQVGYAGGHTPNPSYEQVCTGTTGHAESVEIQYDPKEISYDELLKVFWESHNPTTKNRQGPDFGAQYRSVIFFYTPEQEAAARRSRVALEKSGKWKNPVTTAIAPAGKFWRAEEYHQHYLAKSGKKFCHLPAHS